MNNAKTLGGNDWQSTITKQEIEFDVQSRYPMFTGMLQVDTQLSVEIQNLETELHGMQNPNDVD